VELGRIAQQYFPEHDIVESLSESPDLKQLTCCIAELIEELKLLNTYRDQIVCGGHQTFPATPALYGFLQLA